MDVQETVAALKDIRDGLPGEHENVRAVQLVALALGLAHSKDAIQAAAFAMKRLYRSSQVDVVLHHKDGRVCYSTATGEATVNPHEHAAHDGDDSTCH